MIARLLSRRHGPIGVDIGSRSIKLLQFSADRTRLLDAVRRELPAVGDADPTSPEYQARIADALRHAREGRDFRGRDVVVCLSDKHLFVQNLRVPKSDGAALERHVQQEAAGRIPFPAAESEIQFFEAADVRQADTLVREVIVLACHKPVLQGMLDVIDASGLRPLAVDVEPAAFVRSYATQYRRDEDRKQRAMFVHVGYSRTGVVIMQGDDVLFIKYVDVGGKQMDEAVARHLEMSPLEAMALRRQNGDRRSELQDEEVARSVSDAVRPVLERLAAELSMCVRYHSVTFRGQPLVRLVMGGGEATPQLLEAISKRLDLKCELSDPLRNFDGSPQLGRKGQWDVAAGLALREIN